MSECENGHEQNAKALILRMRELLNKGCPALGATHANFLLAEYDRLQQQLATAQRERDELDSLNDQLQHEVKLAKNDKRIAVAALEKTKAWFAERNFDPTCEAGRVSAAIDSALAQCREGK